MKFIINYINTIFVVLNIALLIYGLHDFIDFNEMMSKKKKIDWMLVDFQYYTFVAAFTTLFQGIFYLFSLCNYRLGHTSTSSFRISNLFDSITLSMNTLVALVFWPTYIINKELLLGKTLCKNPKYFFDIIMHLCPLIISILILFRRPDFSREIKRTRFFLRVILLFIIDTAYLAIILYAKTLYGRYPYPMLNKFSIPQICASIGAMFVIEVSFMALIQYPIQKFKILRSKDDIFETPITGNIQ